MQWGIHPSEPFFRFAVTWDPHGPGKARCSEISGDVNSDERLDVCQWPVQSSLTLEWESITAPLVSQNTCWNISDSNSGLGGGISGRHGPGNRNQCVSQFLWESPELAVLLKRRQWKRIRRNKNRRSQRNEWWRWVKRGQPKMTASGRRRELGSFSIMTP